ncbi:Box C/D snoRNA protein [Actinidia chinensis var. chinensis]|uniref:Box C/D snoRNA protein 1 n=1 Tax=Actinidia chinensis var. chinensis TaxID=1590841 RepID=A0A2R6QPX4_ACTCC|nr:Box C/D snoRNA protein [Actinidia chinensis var. chinensis]
MDEQEETSSANPNNKQSVPCKECKVNPSKYKCPGCSVRSCSLPCVKAHKQRTGCTGKRQQTQFVPLSQFDDNLLLSDYNMLEDVKRIADSAQRMRLKLCGYSHFRLPFPLKGLRSAAANRRTKLLFLPSGMTKRETNRSYYNNRKKFISWTIEWRFHSTDVVLTDHGVDENTNLCSVVEKHLGPGPWNHQLKQFCDEPLDSLKFFIRKYPKGPKSPFRELDIKAPIRQQLANLMILEYPVIHVFLPSHKYDFEVIKDAVPCRTEIKESISNNHPSQKGVTFREEEIEDDSCSDRHILDLTKHVKPNQGLQISPKDNGTEKELNAKPLLENASHVHKAEDSTSSSFKSKNPAVFDGMDFDFEQGLIDAYTDLIAQTNPDDFLDLEGMFPDDFELDERTDDRDFSGIIPEELEEGEIPGN